MTNCIKHKAVERIWLVPDAIDGELGYVWCDDPAPGVGMDLSEAVEYVRRDAHDARVAKIEQERDELAAQILALADALEEAEAPDAEAGDMWDASQCADWLREQSPA